jgi:hypothetical protein
LSVIEHRILPRGARQWFEGSDRVQARSEGERDGSLVS